ncbi:MAG: hypothetical protein AAGK22_25675 [Acidobacteriota bacterium]
MQNNERSEVGPSSADQFLQQALGNNSGDSRLAGGLMTVALVAAVIAVGWKRLRARKAGSSDLSDR